MTGPIAIGRWSSDRWIERVLPVLVKSCTRQPNVCYEHLTMTCYNAAHTSGFRSPGHDPPPPPQHCPRSQPPMPVLVPQVRSVRAATPESVPLHLHIASQGQRGWSVRRRAWGAPDGLAQELQRAGASVLLLHIDGKSP